MEYRITTEQVALRETVLETTAEIPFDAEVSLPDYCPDIGKILRCRAVPSLTVEELRGRVMRLLTPLEDELRLCRTGGAFFLVHRAERLSEVFCKLSEAGLEPKRLRTVSHNIASEPSLILVEARRGGKAGLKIMPPLFLRNSDGSETDEILKIYHREEKA